MNYGEFVQFEGYGEDGYDCYGYKEDGYNKAGLDRQYYDRDGFHATGYNRDGYNRYGHTKNDYGEDGYDKEGYKENGYNARYYDRDGFYWDGYNDEGYKRNGLDRHGFDKNGFDKDGVDKDGYDVKGIYQRIDVKRGTGYMYDIGDIYRQIMERWGKNEAETFIRDMRGRCHTSKSWKSDWYRPRKGETAMNTMEISMRKDAAGNNRAFLTDIPIALYYTLQVEKYSTSGIEHMDEWADIDENMISCIPDEF